MTIQRAYKVELAPNNKQLTLFKKAAGIARFVWNWALADRQYRYKNLEGDENTPVPFSSTGKLIFLSKLTLIGCMKFLNVSLKKHSEI